MGMNKYIAVLVVLLLAGCAGNRVVQKDDFRQMFVQTLKENKGALSNKFSDYYVAKCLPGKTEQAAEDFYSFTVDCIYDIDDDMPDMLSKSDSVDYEKKVDQCARVKFVKKYKDDIDMQTIPRENRSRCLQILNGFEDVIALTK